jgi:hypothetical protein
MANTYTLIEAQTLASSAASVTFSSIPATYTDLVIRASIRTDQSNATASFYTRFNGSSATNYSRTSLYTTNASTAASFRESNVNGMEYGVANGDTATSNTFANFEIYIPSYTASQNKPSSAFGVAENNATSPIFIQVSAGLRSVTDAITSIELVPSGNWLTTSSFYLYGIKNS